MMFKLALVCTMMFVSGCQASYGYGSGSSGMSSGSNYGSKSYGGSSSSIPVSIQTRHEVKYIDVPSQSYAKPTAIEVSANSIPIELLFKSASSYINVKQYHQGAQGSNQETESEDEAHYLRHTVKKPVYQEVREIISPYRKIIQEVKPVDEAVETLIARSTSRGAPKSSSGYGSEYSASSSSSSKSGY